jgi:GNAT superfamily N-acetyltransferase
MLQNNLKATQVQTRPAASTDAERLALLCTQLGYPADASTAELRLKKSSARPDRATFVALSAGGEVMGFIDLNYRCIMVNDSTAEICGLVVDERARGKGYGTALIRQAEIWAKAQGASEIALRSNIIRKEAHAFYESLGFSSYKQALVFRKNLNDH